MYLQVWIRRWMIAVWIGLLMIAICSVGFLWNEHLQGQSEDSRYVINRARLQVSGIMQYLEQHGQEVAGSAEVRNKLLVMSKESRVSFIYTGLDGRVLFNASSDTALQQIDVRTGLHYDLYQARTDQDQYRIAFPVVDEAAQAQVGNAIFTLPAEDVFVPKTNVALYLLSAIIAVIVVILCILLLLLRRKIRQDVLIPVRQLKDYSEAILKGNYEPKATYDQMDELGEVHTMFEQMRMEIQHLSRRREEQEQAQKELISNISHDLKTPLATLKAYIEAMREGVCPDMDTVMEYAGVMYNNTEKMARLTEDLLLHALKELGQISVTPKERYSKELLQSILQPIAHYVRTTGVHFIEPTDIPDVLIHVDGHRLEQVVSNLITNALKHTEPGDMISVNTELEQGQFKVTIADTGRGILPQDMPFVFERYFQGKADRVSVIEGSGLGLSICKYIIEAHHGTISFRSMQGQGTTFYCLIPL
ncbi:HAMP domain-containing histidine kinase [Paenibacillus motobuensis]|uniref:sensor histidine kinase n=1 Tax=Paenibacillus TaxID=44249 RepID=UPI00203DA6AA|nr:MULTISPECIES: HAMP domain-containing sensor histidine kinase [Paenibacillus]MCM3042056.1 HAMP domain-containing histidine kinase [Paenibacillus lutimineralis]MCM3649160.1 HAMP domain-containing histidine kinase [Paenibacillus motobuensis]